MHADLRHIRLVGEWHRFLEYFGSADDPDFTAVQAVIRNGLLTGQIQRVIQRIHHGGARREIGRVMRDDDVVAVGQRTELRA